ncbi:hypothetical protein ACSLBF_04605 [Pseudoalteromonas sp. T1lg65]|uniref:hypothetical protein n=1 Tax=Pseudoalteromonas sp. T1lg65 TaxID=2077101 RepID=UPI003F7A51AF
MSITPYQYQLLTQSLASVRPNFHGFCTSWYHQVQKYNLNMQIPDNVNQLILWEHQVFEFIQGCVMRLPQQANLLYFLRQRRAHLLYIGTSPRDLDILLSTFFQALKVQQGRTFTAATKNAWNRALLLIKNMLNHELFSVTNVTTLHEFKQQQHAK